VPVTLIETFAGEAPLGVGPSDAEASRASKPAT
jgi:hypothetical protein